MLAPLQNIVPFIFGWMTPDCRSITDLWLITGPAIIAYQFTIGILLFGALLIAPIVNTFFEAGRFVDDT